jgi:hypothetical protein
VAEKPRDTLLEEIDEELRQEHYAKLWKRYGNHVIGAALLIVVGVAGYQGWRHYDLTNRQAAGERLAEAMRLAAGDRLADAQQILAKLAVEGAADYPMLARFQQAALLARQGETARAVATYRQLAEDQAIDGVYRDLALVIGAYHELAIAEPKELTQRLSRLDADNNPWRHSAREIAALASLRAGERDKARELFEKLAADTAAPSGVRARASEMLIGLAKA